MKKLLIFSFVLMVTMGLVFSAGLTVNQPSGGTWYKGTTHNITWTPSACTSSNYKINIYKDSVVVANFVEQLLANGVTSKSWTVPMGYTNGTYIIRVKAEDDSCLGDSAPFQITDAPGPATASITVTHPTLNEEFCRGEAETISWTTTGTVDGNVKINIFRGAIDPANFVTQLSATTASGSKVWNVPASQALGTNYHVRVKESAGTIQGDSPAFKVAECDGGMTPIDPGKWERLKDLLRRIEKIPWWRGPKGPWPGPGPGPCLSCPVFETSKLKDLISKLGLKEQVGIQLFKGGEKVADLGKFGPKSRLGKRGMKLNKLGRMGLMRNRVALKSLSPEKSKMFGKGGGYKLIIINSMGEVIAENGIILQEELMK